MALHLKKVDIGLEVAVSSRQQGDWVEWPDPKDCGKNTTNPHIQNQYVHHFRGGGCGSCPDLPFLGLLVTKPSKTKPKYQGCVACFWTQKETWQKHLTKKLKCQGISLARRNQENAKHPGEWKIRVDLRGFGFSVFSWSSQQEVVFVFFPPDGAQNGVFQMGELSTYSWRFFACS